MPDCVFIAVDLLQQKPLMIRVYAYSGCDTCRRALRFLKDKALPHEVVPIRETPPSEKELRRALALVDGQLKKLFNTSGQDYRAMELGTKLAGMTEAQAIALLAKNGNLVKRPFVIHEKGVLVGFREDEWKTAFSK